MKLQRLERVVRLRASLDDVWEFFADPRNLREITPPWLDLQIVSPVPDRMYPGLLIEYRVRPFPGPAWVWVTEITHVQEGVRFVDEQRIGPYRLWHHEHHFRASGHGVEVRDLVVSTCSPEAGPGTWRSDGPCARGFRRSSTTGSAWS